MSSGPAPDVAALDVGGTHVSAALVDVGARRVRPGTMSREPLDGDGSAEEIVAALVRCAARLPAGPGTPWAIALPGPFDYVGGIGLYEGVGKFDALRGVDLRAALAARLPGAGTASFHNDADAFVLGEWWAGSARGHRHAVGITLGTGVGSGFLRDGRLLRQGSGVPPEGRVDLLRYEDAPLEETVSRRAIRRAYAEAAGGPPTLDVQQIAQLALSGDRVAEAVFERTFHALGTVLGPWLAAFQPTVLVVGGSIAASWDLVARPLRAGLAAAAPETADGRIAVEPAAHSGQAALLGAAHLAATWPERSPSRPVNPSTTGR